MTIDVPSPNDLRLMEDARPWAETALARRPVRPEIFDAFARVDEVMVRGGLALHRAS